MGLVSFSTVRHGVTYLESHHWGRDGMRQVDLYELGAKLVYIASQDSEDYIGRPPLFCVKNKGEKRNKTTT